MLKKCEPFDRGLNGSFSHIKRFFILHIKSIEKGGRKRFESIDKRHFKEYNNGYKVV